MGRTNIIATRKTPRVIHTEQIQCVPGKMLCCSFHQSMTEKVFDIVILIQNNEVNKYIKFRFKLHKIFLLCHSEGFRCPPLYRKLKKNHPRRLQIDLFFPFQIPTSFPPPPRQHLFLFFRQKHSSKCNQFLLLVLTRNETL